MATTITQTSTNSDEDYIDMEVTSSSSSSSTFLFYSITSPPQTRDFEFQMSSISLDKDTTTSPADELFYKGKLLPLHLPPRLQMVQNLIENQATLDEKGSIPFSTTPSISPSESGRVSCELNPDEYFFDWNIMEMSGVNLIGENSKKSWGRRLKQLKQSSLGQKLKASRSFIRYLFSKSACSNESCAKSASNSEPEMLRIRDCLSKYSKMAKKNNERYKKIPEAIEDGVVNNHRRSFSGAISAIKYSSTSSSTLSSGSSSSSSSFSFSSNGVHDLSLKRSSSASSELESSIQGAIAHCKQSQQISRTKKDAVSGGNQERLELFSL